jgi:TetR/AcrR family transcriptional regulator, mexCD-oprJ operon repressor
MSASDARSPLQQRVAATILEAAGRLLAARGEQASMHDVAVAAGVARATVYRYFPSRQALLDELADRAVRDAGQRLASARIDAVPPRDAIVRAIRALVEVGDLFVVLAREHVRPDQGHFERAIREPLERLVERGRELGVLRDDLPGSWLTEALVGLVVSLLSARSQLGRDDTIAAITSMFLDGAGKTQEPGPSMERRAV